MRSQFNKENAFLLNDEDDIAARPVNKKSGFRRRKRDGSTDANSPYHKKITKDLDSDDELMMTMREKGYTDQQIADRLTREGRVRYDRKSICTRIARVKQAQAAYVDKLLEEGYKEWEIEDVGPPYYPPNDHSHIHRTTSLSKLTSSLTLRSNMISNVSALGATVKFQSRCAASTRTPSSQRLHAESVTRLS